METTPSQRLALGMAGAALVISVATSAWLTLHALDQPRSHPVTAPALAAPPGAGETGLTRIMFPNQALPDAAHSNQMISLAHNWFWHPREGWKRPAPDRPTAALTFESWYYGLAELNFDIRPPQGSTDWPGGRGMGFAARHDGSYASFTVGGRPYSVGGAGLKFNGGWTDQPLLELSEASGVAAPTVLRVRRGDNTSNLLLEGGWNPTLIFGLDGVNADQRGGRGALRFVGRPVDGSVLGFDDTEPESLLMASHPRHADSEARFSLSAGGRLSWGGGSEAPDVRLERSRAGRLSTDGELAAKGLVIGEDGAILRQLRSHVVALEPTAVPRGTTREQRFRVPGLASADMLFVNAPAQPNGIAVAHIRMAAPEEVAITFVNATANPLAPSSGTYTILAVQLDPPEAKTGARW